jgi:flagellar motility protein MotE (MotC chaperone)
MPDETPEEQKAREAAAEAQMLAQTDAASGGSRRFRPVRAVLLAGAAFLLSALIALILGGHFRREPLAKLRQIPLLGRLIPAPPEPAHAPAEPEKIPTVADMHPMPVAELNQLLQGLQKARDEFQKRQADLRRDEGRLRFLQESLQREQDRLEEMMAGLTKRQAEVDAQRQALDAQAILIKAEERKRIAQLARIAEAQNPTIAAAELAALDRGSRDNLAIKILAEVQEKRAAAIFDAMKPEAAIALKGRMVALRSEAEPRPKKEEQP